MVVWDGVQIAQMPLPLTISRSSKSRLVLTFLVLPFWYLLTQVDLDIFQASSKTVVCVQPEQDLSRICKKSRFPPEPESGTDLVKIPMALILKGFLVAVVLPDELQKEKRGQGTG